MNLLVTLTDGALISESYNSSTVKINQYISRSLHPSVFFSPQLVIDKGHIGFSWACSLQIGCQSIDAHTLGQFRLSNYTNRHILTGRNDEKTHTDMESMWAPGLVSMWCHPKTPNERIISNIRAADVSLIVIRSVTGMAVSRFQLKCQEHYKFFQPRVDHMVQLQRLKFTPDNGGAYYLAFSCANWQI